MWSSDKDLVPPKQSEGGHLIRLSVTLKAAWAVLVEVVEVVVVVV